MDRHQLYDAMAERKSKPKDFQPYQGDNGRVNRCVQLIKEGKLRSGGELLDVGGGIGDLCYAANSFFDHTAMVDISDLSVRSAMAKGVDAFQLDIDRQGLLGVGDDQLTLVTALDFIEHIVDPDNFARECFRVLKPGGQVFINTPNIEFWKHLHSQVFEGKFPHTSGDREVYHGGHLAFYNWNDMVSIFGAAGFKNFRQFHDDEGYQQPTTFWLQARQGQYSNQAEYVALCERLGNPNLLFACDKPA